MIRILQVVNIMDRAGLETMLMNYYRNINRDVIQFDFLVHREEKGAYDDEIEMLGGKIYHAPRLYPQNYVLYFNYMKQFFDEHKEYNIVHSHIDTMSAFPLLAAKWNSVPIRIAHSHTSKLDIDAKLLIKYLAKIVVPYVANRCLACGEKAGLFLFGKRKYKIIHNAINLSNYSYNAQTRKEMRQDLGVDDKFVIGHVGRYSYIKNQVYLLEILKEILKTNERAVLLLVGKGDDEHKLRTEVIKSGLEKQVFFLIDRSDVERIYQAFDIFVMPSLFEGLPLVGIEAQANGLTCLFSKNISDEVLCTNTAEYLPLEASVWVDRVLAHDSSRNPKAKEELKKRGYDIVEEAIKLQQYYLEQDTNKI